MRDLNNLPDLELALVQTSLIWQDAAANRERFAVLLDQASGADLIVLPEMFTTGFSMDSAALAEPEEGPTYAWLRAQAARLDTVITGSAIIEAADGVTATDCSGRARMVRCCTTTSVICSAWRVSTSTTRQGSSRRCSR